MLSFKEFSLAALKNELLTNPAQNRSFIYYFQRLTFVLSIAYLTTFALLGSWIGFSAVTAFFVVLLLSFDWVRKNEYERTAVALAVLFVLVPPICIFFSGGVESPYLPWLVTPIFASAALVGPRTAILTSCAVALFYLATLAAHSVTVAVNELVPGYHTLLSAMSVVSATIFLGAFAWKKVSDLRGAVGQLQQLIDDQERIYATIGHELRTPAATLDMLLVNACEQNPSGDDLREIRHLTTHLLAIIDDMKLATSAGARAENLNDQHRVMVYSTVERSIQGLYDLAYKHNVSLSLDGVKATQRGHLGSPKAIRQIVQNLVKNAILHSEGSRVEVKLRYEFLDNAYTQFAIRVCDDGKGIDAADRGRLFEAFVRGNTRAAGSGLGLHICKTLAEGLPQGALIYRDQPQGGACFELRFTLKQLEEEQISEAADTLSPIYGKQILMVEDTASLRMLGQAMLESAGATVCVAEDGVEALAAMKLFDPDLVLTDIMMPNMNGYQLTEALRAGGYDRPIIGVTGATVGNEASTLLAAGADRVLAKPMTRKGLEQVILETEHLRSS